MRTTSRSVEAPTHDDMVSFARAMHDVTWQYSSEPGECVLSYFEAPHKWDEEYRMWLELGGTLEPACLDPLEHWLDNKDIAKDEDDEA